MMLRHLPNLITLSRLAMAPPIAWLVLQGDMLVAAPLFVIVAASDALDGSLARRYGWESRLGGILDPLADKTLMLLTAAALWQVERIPGWFVALVLARDLSIVGGALLYHRLVEPLIAAPSAISKLCTAIHASMLVAFMLRGIVGINDALCQLLLIATTVLMVASGVHYIGRYTRLALVHNPSNDHD